MMYSQHAIPALEKTKQAKEKTEQVKIQASAKTKQVAIHAIVPSVVYVLVAGAVLAFLWKLGEATQWSTPALIAIGTIGSATLVLPGYRYWKAGKKEADEGPEKPEEEGE